MAAQRITNGPSKWDIMLGFFENKVLTFTLKDGTVIKMKGVEAMWDMYCDDPLTDGEIDDIDYHCGGIAEGYLLRGPTEDGEYEVFLEYRLRSRSGICAVVELNDCSKAYLPKVWSKIMGLKNSYTTSPSR